MDKKYQIFISSTYKDLIPEREKVRDVVLSMYHFPIGMEMFNAADEEQWEIIRETIDSSDYYVLILGKRYGSTIPPGKPDAGMSYTEKEFRYAVSRGIPVLAFIKKDSAVTADKMDTAPTLIAKLQALVNEITGSREADWFTNVDELGLKVTLARLFHEIQRNGQLMNFVISNDGTAKATDVNITLEFPDSFILFKRAEAERFSEPTPPKMPTNPIDEAMARRHMAGNALRQMIHMMGNSYAGLNFSKANPLDLDTAILGNDFTAGWSVEIESNNVKIWSRDILHTYSRIAEICFIPTKKGNYRIKVSMMCEEYLQPEDSELEVVVE